MMEKNLIDMTQQLQELRDGMSAAEAEAEDSKRIAAELTQKLADREHFWNDQHTQIKNTVGKEVAEVRARPGLHRRLRLAALLPVAEDIVALLGDRGRLELALLAARRDDALLHAGFFAHG